MEKRNRCYIKSKYGKHRHSHDKSANERIQMNCQALFSGKKEIVICHLSSLLMPSSIAQIGFYTKVSYCFILHKMYIVGTHYKYPRKVPVMYPQCMFSWRNKNILPRAMTGPFDVIVIFIVLISFQNYN